MLIVLLDYYFFLLIPCLFLHCAACLYNLSILRAKIAVNTKVSII